MTIGTTANLDAKEKTITPKQTKDILSLQDQLAKMKPDHSWNRNLTRDELKEYSQVRALAYDEQLTHAIQSMPTPTPVPPNKPSPWRQAASKLGENGRRAAAFARAHRQAVAAITVVALVAIAALVIVQIGTANQVIAWLRPAASAATKAPPAPVLVPRIPKSANPTRDLEEFKRKLQTNIF